MRWPCIFLLLFLGASTALGEDIITWTNKDGNKIEAAFIGVEGDQVRLKFADGRQFSYSITDLSLDSQGLLQELLRNADLSRLPKSFHQRIGEKRHRAAVEKYGGDPEVLEAATRALDWLATQQNADGSLGQKYTVGATGLALLAFLGHGETPESDRYGETVTKAILYLMERGLDKEGLIYNGQTGAHISYEHAIATQALVEALVMTRGTEKEIPKLETLLKRSLDHIARGFADDGGWAYGYLGSGQGDLSLSNWQIQALWLAKESGYDFSGVEDALDKGVRFVLTMQDDKGAFKYRFDNPVGKSSLTGGALFSLRNGGKQDDPVYEKGIDYLDEAFRNPTPGSTYYSPYFNTLAFFHDKESRWKTYSRSFFPKLLQVQKDDGSWADPKSAEEGDMLNTAWATLMLESFYRYDRDTPAQ